ncbi:hypothetical protein LJK88_18335 [Paenibacillus sp. P26]|nr:hypothetical protein LJK88_18335 [Paenibacillus sp. P26]
MMVTYTTSQYNGWTYLVAQPAHVVLEKVLYIKKITFTMAFIFLTLGLVIAYLIAYRNSRPLRGIMETIAERTGGEHHSGADAYRFIREAVSQLIDKNREMQEKMEKQAPPLQAALFERSLKGNMSRPGTSRRCCSMWGSRRRATILRRPFFNCAGTTAVWTGMHWRSWM